MKIAKKLTTRKYGIVVDRVRDEKLTPAQARLAKKILTEPNLGSLLPGPYGRNDEFVFAWIFVHPKKSRAWIDGLVPGSISRGAVTGPTTVTDERKWCIELVTRALARREEDMPLTFVSVDYDGVCRWHLERVPGISVDMADILRTLYSNRQVTVQRMAAEIAQLRTSKWGKSIVRRAKWLYADDLRPRRSTRTTKRRLAS